ncbi:hypothetical protein GLOIN_2v1776994 [Rhizophagus clarus]|uniref:Uncharacterized protein n=1 Tax=Rhizophagus clarus TaxID=94130 RepID=A0A8H3QTY2_9GLOM|nr:hypothetical protein GLOIN_2v1776994 [Rhizophagus clarus]
MINIHETAMAQEKYSPIFTDIAHKTIYNFYLEPNCFNVKNGTYVALHLVENGNHTITTNAGTFGDCNFNLNSILNIFKVRERINDAAVIKPRFKNDTKFNYELYYKCDPEKITIILVKKTFPRIINVLIYYK